MFESMLTSDVKYIFENIVRETKSDKQKHMLVYIMEAELDQHQHEGEAIIEKLKEKENESDNLEKLLMEEQQKAVDSVERLVARFDSLQAGCYEKQLLCPQKGLTWDW